MLLIILLLIAIFVARFSVIIIIVIVSFDVYVHMKPYLKLPKALVFNVCRSFILQVPEKKTKYLTESPLLERSAINIQFA